MLTMESQGITRMVQKGNCVVNSVPGKKTEDPPPLPADRCGIASAGWGTMICIGAGALTFLLCVTLLPSNIFPVSRDPFANSIPLVAQGKIVIYPTPENYTQSVLLPPNDLARTMDTVNKVLKEYGQNQSNSHVKCWLQNPSFSHPCSFDISWLVDTLNQSTNFGYTETNLTFNPCVLLRIEKTKSWDPIPYRPEYAAKFPFKDYDPGYFRLDCRLKYFKDSPKLRGIQVFPDKGFSRLFFPQSAFDPKLYLSPIVIVQAVGLRAREDVSVVCNILVENAMYLEDNGEVTINFKANEQ